MRRNALKHLAVAGACAALLGTIVFPAKAAVGLQLITPYPAVSVAAGKGVTLNLEAITPARQRVSLKVVEIPSGWQANFRGGGFVIHGVFGSPKDKDNTPNQIQLEIKVPGDVPQGDYRVAVQGSTGSVTDTLVIDVRVSETAAGAVTLVPEFPSLRGSATENFSFKVTLTNNSPEKTSFALNATGPEGWRVTARPAAETRAATVAVDGGGTSDVTVEADPPDEIVAGSYPIKVKAEGGGKSAEVDLSVEVTGNVAMTLKTSTERLNVDARAGRTTEVPMVIRNTGTAPLTSVTLTSTPPSGWKVDFDKEKLGQIAPKGSARVTAKVTPAAEAVAGDYAVNVTASGEGQSEEVELRVSVETSRLWGVVGLLVIAGALGGLLWVFRRYGRR